MRMANQRGMSSSGRRSVVRRVEQRLQPARWPRNEKRFDVTRHASAQPLAWTVQFPGDWEEIQNRISWQIAKVPPPPGDWPAHSTRWGRRNLATDASSPPQAGIEWPQ